jgi:hypothetical protein
MLRELIFCFSLLTAALGAAADDGTAPAPSTPALAASAPAVTQGVDATKQRAKKQPASTKAGDGKGEAAAQDGPATQPNGDVKMSGMSILGNEDAPKSLVLVPWKSSQLADMPSVSRLLDSSTQPVDKDVFMRELAYYEFKSGSK